ncbi:ABC transporter ATP-binding protein [Puniceicoccales bacterium CK1056]|uniref:ABC transporter ATP-binding protein n=1 Tax=Oceanipulchritudo coccoides TaxID=2706888 RepID=A0A6B2M1G0_9BACT|nr:ABC transporter ATP-binding protein [Oceanipulchritudo coccoides]NDV62553.1 ABC transporter ATP-binding protein [Oceanipulchritudo coccoides]
MPEKETSIVADGLSKSFGGHKAVRNLSFRIEKGEIVGFLGPNGAGKSTTLRILTGILPADSGYLSVCGKSVPYHPDEVKNFIGYMPENNPLPEHMRVIEYLRFRAQIKGIPLLRRKAAIERALEVCELHRKARRKIIGNLSKGFRQRVGIADAILASPAITILDEPTIGLDPHQVIAIRRLLANLRGETTVLFSSHILSEVEITCDRVLILNQGRLVAQGTSDELRKQFLPGSRYRLEVSGGRQEIMDALRKLGDLWEIQIHPQSQEDSFSVNLVNPKNGQNGEGILRQLIQSDRLAVRQFQAVQPSLEDIFLTATQRSWELTGDENKETGAPFPTDS